jgi:acyl-CoA thioesterase FadM
MNLWLRLLVTFLGASMRAALPTPLDVSRLRFRVLPNDIDALLHMNNGRYLTVMDLGRVDLLIRTGLWNLVRRKGWTPLVGTALVNFRREMHVFQSYFLETRIAGWVGQLAVIEHKFVFAKGPRTGEVAAIALVRAGLYDRAQRAFVPLENIMKDLGVTVASPVLPPEALAFLDAEEKLRRAGAAEATSPANQP